MRIFAVEILIFMILSVTLIEGQKWSDYNNVKVKKSGQSSVNDNEGETENSADISFSSKSKQSKPVNRAGIGGWGIIAITLTVIFSGVGIYYFILFYPIVCKKERMYDVMEMTTV